MPRVGFDRPPGFGFDTTACTPDPVPRTATARGHAVPVLFALTLFVSATLLFALFFAAMILRASSGFTIGSAWFGQSIAFSVGVNGFDLAQMWEQTRS